jgi:hypothetical protein
VDEEHAVGVALLEVDRRHGEAEIQADGKSFSMKDLGEAAFILGIKIYRDRSIRLIGFSQSTYLDRILKKLKMDQSKKGSCLFCKV